MNPAECRAMAQAARYRAMAYRCEAIAYNAIGKPEMAAHAEAMADSQHDLATQWDEMAKEAA